MRMGICDAAALAAALLLASPADAKPEPPRALKIRFDTSPRVDCHWYLRTYGKRSVKPQAASKVGFEREAASYAEASSRIVGDAAWRWFESLVVAGPEMAAIREAAKNPPEAIAAAPTRAAMGSLAEALESAYPGFLGTVWVEHQKALSPFLFDTRRRFDVVEARVSEDLMKKMAFSPIDAPVTVYVVMRGGGESSWGKIGSGYYAVVGQSGLSSLAIMETGLHQATHLIDALQPFDSGSILKQVRDGLGTGSPEAVERFLHGLVAYNAGALVKRFVDRTYVPEGVRAPGQEEAFRPYLSTYEFIWRDYLDGKIAQSAIVPKLIEEFRAVQRLQGSPR